GRVLSRRPFPWPVFQNANPLARQGYFVAPRKDTTWAFALAFGDAFFVFDGLKVRQFVGRMAEAIPLPDVIVSSQGFNSAEKLGRVTAAARSIAIDDRYLSILFSGSDTSVSSRVIDRFALKTGAYVDSYLLPAKARYVAQVGPQLLVLTSGAILSVKSRNTTRSGNY
ncbi:MAG: hypothetical protein JWM95_10, partial [Gemmatimonadetes bacterium]|nr:hypothetical protein [Gemmatimonadota bacterium]